MDERLARDAARELLVRRPYRHIRQDALDPWLLFEKYDLLDRVLHDIVLKLGAERIGCVASLSYWGFPLAVSLADYISRESSGQVRCVCFGGDVFEEPSQLPLVNFEEDAVIIDDVVHSGGTLRDAVKVKLRQYGYRVRLAVVALDQDSVDPREGLQEILSEGDCDVYAVTRSSLVPRSVRWRNSLQGLFVRGSHPETNRSLTVATVKRAAEEARSVSP